MNTEHQVAEVRESAERAAEMSAEMRALDFGVVDMRELDDAAVRAVPLLRRVVRAELVVAEIAKRVRSSHPEEATVLAEAAGAIGEFTSACGQGRMAVFLVNAAPATIQSARPNFMPIAKSA